MIEGLSGAKVGFGMLMEEVEGEALRGLAVVGGNKGLLLLMAGKGLLETLDILVVADDGVVLELLLLVELLLVVVAIPEVVIAADMGQDDVGKCG